MVLARVHRWDVFGTLTWSSVPSTLGGTKLLFAHLYGVSRSMGVPFRRLLWAVREERGEHTDRLHLHVLLGGFQYPPNVSDCFRLNSAWGSLPRCGWARHHIFNRSLNGVAYIVKCLSKEGTEGGDWYESGKFGSGSKLVLSDSVYRCVGGRRIGVLAPVSLALA